MTTTPEAGVLREEVRARYAARALRVTNATKGGCCGGGECDPITRDLYDSLQAGEVPGDALLASLGCGNPTALARLAPGETVLDLGSGTGKICFIAAQVVGPRGRVIGVDMTPEMIAKARAGAERGGYAQVEFRQGRLEALPVDDATVDAVTSNCVINLVPDKSAVFQEVARVLKPGGRLVVSDILLDRELPGPIAQDVLAYVGCVAGAELRETDFGRLRAAGLGDIEILRDEDYLDALLAAAPAEVEELSQRTGIPVEAVQGAVRSITYRARRPQI